MWEWRCGCFPNLQLSHDVWAQPMSPAEKGPGTPMPRAGTGISSGSDGSLWLGRMGMKLSNAGQGLLVTQLGDAVPHPGATAPKAGGGSAGPWRGCRGAVPP